MGFFDTIKASVSSFMPQGPTGLLLDPPEAVAAAPRHELFVGGGPSKDWRASMPSFRTQGSSYWCTAFAGTAIASAFEHEERGGKTAFSALELFYRTGGSVAGNYLLSTAAGMKESLVLESDVPTPAPASWGNSVWAYWKDRSAATKEQLAFGRQFRTKSHASVIPDTAHLRAALGESPLMVAVGIGKDYWLDRAPRQTSYSVYHAVALVHVEDDGTKVVFDSLKHKLKPSYDGFHRLAPDYEILSAVSFIDLPEGWKEVQARDDREKFQGALNQYGQKRVLAIEQGAAKVLEEALQRNPGVRSAMGREWTVAVNALSYGGYSVQDLLNHYTSLRRGQGPIFDLDRPRPAKR